MVRPKGAQFSIRIEPDLITQLEAEAKAVDRSVSWIVREAIRQYLAKKGHRST